MAASTLTSERVVADIADILAVPTSELTPETNVIDLGLDSVRLMSLIERWRAAGATRADVVTLAADPTISAWIRELT